MGEKEALFEQIREAIASLDDEKAKSLTKKLLEIGASPVEIIQDAMQPALALIGEKYERNEAFLTDLILAGDLAKELIEIMQPYLKAEKAESAGRVVIGTVEGDIHDIGKGIVIGVLLASGFEVYDIGVDQPARAFVQKAIEVNADVVGASAILGGTKFRVKEIHEELTKVGIRNKVILICGGWGFTEAMAESLGADAVGETAWDGLKKIKALMKEKKGL
ncbi:MAG: cobalamin-dependent protein [Candidatus Bathyarchaeia archaeon]